MIDPFPIAVRSLLCQDHAINLPPRVKTVHWFLGKRCNYDCSYCPSHIHDAVSPFIDLDQALSFCDRVDVHCQQRSNHSKWAFTGGEPFVDPNFLTLANHIRHLGSYAQMNVVTNGSMPLEIYQQAANVFTGITVSLHLERSMQEINRTLQNLPKISGTFLSVNLMFLPGQIDWVRDIARELDHNHIPWVLRKITPDGPNSSQLDPFIARGSGHKDRKLLPLHEQRDRKLQARELLDSQRQLLLATYYSQAELDLLIQTNQRPTWSNCGVWYSDHSYREINSDHLVATDQIGFLGWTCYAGVDSLYVDFDGSLYVGFCQSGGAIGHLSDKDLLFLDQPVTCSKQWCTCNMDIPIRKALPGSEDFVNGSRTDPASP